ncbi:cytochrome-c peroxidase [Gynuella sunshinyii]|uniref:Cytochrome c peroxidase n=1 Tax=Gynuella sunshinyii YC6258 TaxID=1445510 RepID=A0A0C5VT99_9GAMM|nr:cytochrome-c peroxidase [Gynuella sunshinyii]AJQ97902.1 cytochrome c peroxidase [Gynuella sunshinyii YC6258]
MHFKFPNKHSAVLISLLSLGVVSQAATNEPIQPIKAPTDINAGQAELGKKLYFDPRLSKSGYISCNSCHNLSMGGTDNITSSIGDQWQQGPINAPTVLNASLNLAQFWDGRAEDLKAQAGGPIANPKEMASNHTLAIEVLKSIPQYVVEFKQVFNSDQITIDQVTTAIAEFEKTLVTPGSRFDQWLEGDKTALNDTELAGYELFKSSGCTACHNGPAVGGSMYQKVGLIKPYQTNNPALGRFDVTGNEADKNVFKVPTLRNIELTYPYFHDGAIKTLSEAVNTMGEIQLGKTFNATENAQIVAFLKTLTGEQPQITLPILPPSNDNTPQPQPFN